MKILCIVPTYKPAYIYGGPTQSISCLCEGLTRAGHTVHVVTTTGNGKTELDVEPNKEMLVDEVKVTYFRRLTKDHTHISFELWKHVFRHCLEYDVVYINSWWNILVVVATWLCHLKKAKVIVSPRGMLSTYVRTATKRKIKQTMHFMLGRRALAKAYFHATSQTEYLECRRLIPGWKGFVLPNILLLPDVDIITGANNQFTLLFLSRIHPKKGLEILFEALSRLQFDVVLKIVGEGDTQYVMELKKKAKALGINEKIKWMSWKGTEEKYVELMNSDLLVLTSHNENFANVVVESLHVGTPVLISEEVGLSAFVKEHNLGWVTSLEVSSITAGLENAFQDVEKRKFINRYGHHKVKSVFAQEVILNQYVEKFSSICNPEEAYVIA